MLTGTRLASETAEERTARLQQTSANRQERLASETAEERTARLQQTSANRHERLASETAEESTARLQQMSANRHERLASETAEEKTARLQQMSTNQHERLASETAEEREVRLQYYSDRHRELQVVQSQHRSVICKNCTCTYTSKVAIGPEHMIPKTYPLALSPICTLSCTLCELKITVHFWARNVRSGSPPNALHSSSYLCLNRL